MQFYMRNGHYNTIGFNTPEHWFVMYVEPDETHPWPCWRGAGSCRICDRTNLPA
jgi:hypothetical protein